MPFIIVGWVLVGASTVVLVTKVLVDTGIITR